MINIVDHVPFQKVYVTNNHKGKHQLSGSIDKETGLAIFKLS